MLQRNMQTTLLEKVDMKTGLTHIEKVRSEPELQFNQVMNIDKIRKLRGDVSELDMCLGLMEDHLMKRPGIIEEEREEREKRVEAESARIQKEQELKRETSAEQRWREASMPKKEAVVAGGILYETGPQGLKRVVKAEPVAEPTEIRRVLYHTSPQGVVVSPVGEEAISMEGKIFRGSCCPYTTSGLHL